MGTTGELSEEINVTRKASEILAGCCMKNGLDRKGTVRRECQWAFRKPLQLTTQAVTVAGAPEMDGWQWHLRVRLSGAICLTVCRMVC